ncbi:MAG TPA: helix-turn-helix transcriptional regulator [Xanthobacteraceae bacterium]|nr:helix-turn-helix transcriptional regulator [Xanthobacteraceae bacterium]
MGRRDDLLATIEAVHAAGLDAELWPQALAATADVVGGNAASLEVVDQEACRHREMHSYRLPGAEEIAFREDFLTDVNVRFRAIARLKLRELTWDYEILDEAVMQRSSFYVEIMPRFDIRCFLAGVVHKTEREFATVAVHRSPRLGHVQQDGIALMRTVVPHLQQAFDVGRRLRSAEAAKFDLERALDALDDGAALIKADGAIAYANAASLAIARRIDGITFRKGAIAIEDANARVRFAEAIAAVLSLCNGEPRSPTASDLFVPRRSGGPPYLISVRPLLGNEQARVAEVVALVFIRDALQTRSRSANALQEAFGLTQAETDLARALQSGVRLISYARARSVSLNTVYTHLRHLREKTGTNRLPQLISKLNAASPL